MLPTPDNSILPNQPYYPAAGEKIRTLKIKQSVICIEASS
jgi:hypothetical protein